MKAIAAALLGLVTIAAVSPASAQVMDRQWRQHHRIEQGVRSGHLTRAEFRRLKLQQARIARTEAAMRYRNGGHLTRHDRMVLRAMQDRANRAIYRDKHNSRMTW